MNQSYVVDSRTLRAPRPAFSPVKRIEAARGVLFGIAVSLLLWALILWLLL